MEERARIAGSSDWHDTLGIMWHLMVYQRVVMATYHLKSNGHSWNNMSVLTRLHTHIDTA